MRVLLVQPPLDPATSKLSAMGMPEPLGLEYIAAAIPDHEVRLLDLRVGGSLAAEISFFDPQVVGTTAVTVGIRLALDLLHEAKSLNKQITTVIGGVHPSLLPEECHQPEVDVIVRGDGEIPFQRLIEHLGAGQSPGDIHGLDYRERSQWSSTPDNPLPPLDWYAPPARHLTSDIRSAYSRVGFGNTATLITSRGCTRRCTFCSVWRFYNGKYRLRSPEAIAAEIASLEDQNINFVDDDSFGDLGRMERLRQLLAEQAPGRSYRALVTAETVVNAPDHFGRWAEAGLKQLIIGFESFREDELRDVNKKASAQENETALRLLNDLGIGVVGYLIVRPEYDHDDFQRLGDTVERLGIQQPVYTTLTPFPGTILYERTRDRLVTDNWEHFDAFRAVTPTRLPRQEYYRELANLYRRAYAGSEPPDAPTEVPWYETLAQAIESIESESIEEES